MAWIDPNFPPLLGNPTNPAASYLGPATSVLNRSQLVDQGDGTFIYDLGDGTRLAVLPDGTLHHSTGLGPWEKGWLVGNKFVVKDSRYPTGAFALLVA